MQLKGPDFQNLPDYEDVKLLFGLTDFESDTIDPVGTADVD